MNTGALLIVSIPVPDELPDGFPVWAFTALKINGVVYAAASIAGPELVVGAVATIDNVDVRLFIDPADNGDYIGPASGHLFVPTDWLKTEFEKTSPVVDCIVKRVNGHEGDMMKAVQAGPLH